MIDRNGHAALSIARLYHWAPQIHRDSILEHGLDRTQSHYTGFWESRPGHVYIGTLGHVRKVFLKDDAPPWDLYHVDIAHLERGRLNPDEDHFLPGLGTNDAGNHYFGANFIGKKQACAHFRREFPPVKWLWEWTEYLKLAPLPSLGQWAEAVGLGSNPAETRYSAGKGSLAYAGIVPPAALSLVRSSA